MKENKLIDKKNESINLQVNSKKRNSNDSNSVKSIIEKYNKRLSNYFKNNSNKNDRSQSKELY